MQSVSDVIHSELLARQLALEAAADLGIRIAEPGLVSKTVVQAMSMATLAFDLCAASGLRSRLVRSD